MGVAYAAKPAGNSGHVWRSIPLDRANISTAYAQSSIVQESHVQLRQSECPSQLYGFIFTNLPDAFLLNLCPALQHLKGGIGDGCFSSGHH